MKAQQIQICMNLTTVLQNTLKLIELKRKAQEPTVIILKFSAAVSISIEAVDRS